jgi:archaellum component FlaC
MTELIGIIGGAMAILGFVAVWIRVGGRLGKNENTLDMLKGRMDKIEEGVASLKNETIGIQITIAGALGEIKAKLDSLQETVATLKGGRRAAEK